MNMEPTQLIRGMDVDIGMGLGDDLGGFEGFDTMFAEPNNTTDFFNFCALEEAQQEQDAATASAFSSPPSPVGVFGQQQRGHDFAQESWNNGGQQQIQAWPSLTLSASEPSRNPSVLLQGGGKPRARKRHDEDEALEAAEEAFPVMKRRSSMASMMLNAGSAPPQPTPEALEKSHSFCVTTGASGGWTPAGSQQQRGVARHGGQQQQQQQQQRRHAQQGATLASPPGGAIKVNTDVTSGTMRPPRISVFMSSSSRRRAASNNSNTTNNNNNQGGGGGSPRLSTPGGYGQLEPTMDRTASAQAQRLKDLRITMRGRSMAEQYVVEHNPAVVAMGSPHHPNSTSALLLGDDEHEEEDQFAAAAAPTLRRASSVGALTIAGNGEVLSTSPVLSATGTILQSCELSDRVGDGGQRRNLVCKVFGSGGSPYLGSANGGR